MWLNSGRTSIIKVKILWLETITRLLVMGIITKISFMIVIFIGYIILKTGVNFGFFGLRILD